MNTNLFKRLLDMIERKIDIVKYWKKRGLVIGNNCEIYQTASFGSEPYLVVLGDNVRINRGVEFVTHDGGVWVLRNMSDVLTGKELKNMDVKKIDLFGPIYVGNNVHIGTNAIIMPNVRIGNNCIIGCGAVVTHDIPNNSIAVGVPAKVIETVEEYYNKHEQDFDITKGLSYKDKEKLLRSKYNL